MVVKQWCLEESIWQKRSAWSDSGTFLDTVEMYVWALQIAIALSSDRCCCCLLLAGMRRPSTSIGVWRCGHTGWPSLYSNTMMERVMMKVRMSTTVWLMMSWWRLVM